MLPSLVEELCYSRTGGHNIRGRQSPTFLVTHAKAGAGYSVIFAMAKKQMCK
jgi:hypothetical protein